MKYNIHLKPEVETLRVYLDNNSYSLRSTPYLSATIHYISDNEAYICNTVGVLDRYILRKFLKILCDRGFTYLRYERKGIMKSIKIEKYTRQK